MRRKDLLKLVALILTPLPFLGVKANPSRAAGLSSYSVPEPEALQADGNTTRLAQEWLRNFQEAKLDRSRLSVTMNQILSDKTLHDGSVALRNLGAPKSMYLFETKLLAKTTTHLFRVTFQRATYTMLVTQDNDSKLSGFAVRQSPRNNLFSVQVTSVNAF